MYLCDMKVIDGLPFREGYYAGAPLCLLYVNGNDQLVPIAIQLKQQPGEDNPIFFPTDGRMDWLLAKIYYQSASLQVGWHCFSCVFDIGETSSCDGSIRTCFTTYVPAWICSSIQLHVVHRYSKPPTNSNISAGINYKSAISIV